MSSGVRHTKNVKSKKKVQTNKLFFDTVQGLMKQHRLNSRKTPYI